MPLLLYWIALRRPSRSRRILLLMALYRVFFISTHICSCGKYLPLWILSPIIFTSRFNVLSHINHRFGKEPRFMDFMASRALLVKSNWLWISHGHLSGPFWPPQASSNWTLIIIKLFISTTHFVFISFLYSLSAIGTTRPLDVQLHLICILPLEITLTWICLS